MTRVSHRVPSDDRVAGENRREDQLADMVLTYDEALSAGQDEADIDLPALSAGAELAAEFEQTKECLELLEKVWPRSRQASDPAKEIHSPIGVNAEADGHHAGDNSCVSDGPAAIAQLGRYQVLKELGRGGAGVVYLAEDLSLGRKVAIKVPRPEFVYSADMRRRFVHEARAAAALDHPNIVRVHETGEAGPACYIATAVCEGPTLAEWLKERGKPVSGPVAAQLICILGDAVEHAHRHGVLHRDLKPGNVLLERRETGGEPATARLPTTDGYGCWQEFIPKLTDFGLAKLLVHERDETLSGAILGTPAYMAPEQAHGRVKEIGTWTDVYGLGTILYELLTGRPAFQGSSDLQTLHRVAYNVPTRPRRLQPKVTRDLEAICLKCLEKEPRERYARAADLTDDLRRYLAGWPTKARPAGWSKRALKFAKRRPAVAGLMAVSALSGLILLCVGLWYGRNLRLAEQNAARFQHALNERQRTITRFEYARLIREAYKAWQNTDVAGAIELLERCRHGPGQEDMRGFEWFYVRRLCDGGLKTLRGHEGRVFGVAFSPTGDRLASCGQDGTVRLWDPVGGRLVTTIAAHSGAVRAVAYSPDGRMLASAGDDARVRLWDATDLRLQTTLEGHAGPVTCLAYAPDGCALATGGTRGVIKVWDIPSGQERQSIQGHSDTVYSLAFSRDGDRLVSGSADKTTKVWELDAPQSPVTVVQDLDTVYAVAISPDGRTLASGGFLRLWSVPGGEYFADLGGHGDAVTSLKFSADGQTLASASEDRTIRIWDLSYNTMKYEYRAHTGAVYDIAFSPRGTLLASASQDGTVRLWDPTVPQDRRRLAIRSGNIEVRVQFAPDGRSLAFSSCDEKRMSQALRSRIADAKTDELLRRSWPGYMTALSFSPDGRYLAVGFCDGPFSLYDTIARKERTFEKIFRQQTDCAFSPDGNKLAVAGFDVGSVTVLDVGTGAELARLPGRRCVAFSPAGRLMAMESAKSAFAIELWDLRAGKSAGVLVGHAGEVYRAEFSADGRLLATGSEDGTARLWDVATRRERFTLRAHLGRVTDVAFTPDGQTLATGSADGTVIFWDVQTGNQLLSLAITKASVTSISFSPDGRVLATGSTQLDAGTQVDLFYAPHDIEGQPSHEKPGWPAEANVGVY